MDRFDGQLKQRRELCRRVCELTFERVDATPLGHVPGQYVQVIAPELACYYSVASPPSSGVDFCICVKDDGGDCAQLLSSCQRGDVLQFRGPGGQLVLSGARRDRRDVLLVATGTGVAPFHAMHEQLDELLGHGQRVHMLYGVRTAEDLLYDEVWRALAARRRGFTYWPSLSAGDAAEIGGDASARGAHLSGRVTAHVESALAALASQRPLVLLCGVSEMVTQVRAKLARAGIPEADVRSDG